MKGKNKAVWVGTIGLILLLGGCSAGSKYTNDSATPQSAPSLNNASTSSYYPSEYGVASDDVAYEYKESYSYDEYDRVEGQLSDVVKTEENAAQGDKIIQTARVDMQTDRFDEVVEQLRSAAPDNGGYVENANLSGTRQRYFGITLRVPTDRFDEVRQYVEKLASVTGSSQNAEDVTARYYDMASRLETKKIEEERVLDMITRAVKIEDLLALEERLGDIRTQIERYQSQMTAIDRLAAYSTIYVGLYEVNKEELIIVSDNLGGRIYKAFIRSVNKTVSFCQELLIFLAGALIPLAVAGLVIFIGIKAALAALRKQNKLNKRSDSNEKS